MQEVTLQDIFSLATNVQGQINQIYLHWSAGHYDNVFEDYHINITGNGQIFISTSNFAQYLPHTWQRNTGAIGMSIMCCAFATSNDLGDPTRLETMTPEELNVQQIPYEPPTEVQIEAMIDVLAVLCKGLNLPCTIDYVKTHAEIADIDGYGPQTTYERWDLLILHNGDQLYSGGNTIRTRAQCYLNQM